MIPRSVIAALCSALTCAAATAADTNAAPTAAATEAPAAKSNRRDPFWPVGYSPTAAVAAASPAAPASAEAAKDEPEHDAVLRIDQLTEEQQAQIRRKLKVSGIMRFGPDYVARINNQLVGAGDEVTVELEGQRLLFAVLSITKDSVQLAPKR